jgi:hypothetical protein
MQACRTGYFIAGFVQRAYKFSLAANSNSLGACSAIIGALRSNMNLPSQMLHQYALFHKTNAISITDTAGLYYSLSNQSDFKSDGFIYQHSLMKQKNRPCVSLQLRICPNPLQFYLRATLTPSMFLVSFTIYSGRPLTSSYILPM